MWIALNNAFLSVVAPKARDIPRAETSIVDPLMVRARKAGHLRIAFPGRRVYEWKGRDYPCRVFVPRAELMGIISAALWELDYDNFKNSVRDDELHDAYSAIWGVMHRYQHGGFARKPRLNHPTFWDDAPLPDGDIDIDDLSFGPDVATVGGRFSDCSRNDCSDDHPCPVCIQRVLDGDDREPEGDRYGAYDSGEDEAEAQSHLRVAPTP